jgi:hypothetical protein
MIRDLTNRKAEATDWRQMHNEELHNLHSSLNIIWMVTSRRMNTMGGACSIHERNMHKIVGKLDGKNHLVDLGVDKKIIFQWILKWGWDWTYVAQARDRGGIFWKRQ